MTRNILIKNGKIALPGNDNFCELDIRINDQGKISKISKDLKINDEFIIDAKGLEIFPGAIDAHVHFDEPGYEHREDFYHGTMLAASGGVTTVIDMPCTSIPPVTDLNSYNHKLSVISSKSVVDYALYAGISAQSFESDIIKTMSGLADKVAGFKVYFLSGMDSFKHINLEHFEDVLSIAKDLKKVVLLHAEDPVYVNKATQHYMEYGKSPKEYYLSRPEEAETIAIKNAVLAAAKTGAELHIVHVASSEGVELLSGYDNITCETAPHYLEFTNKDFFRQGAVLKVAPCIKSKSNKKVLWEQLRNGSIDFVSTDHAPAGDEEKNTGSIWTDYSGIAGVNILFPYLYSEGYRKKRITLSKLLEISSENKAKRYGLFDEKGSIETGKHADLVFMYPVGHYSTPFPPYNKIKFKGRIHAVMLRGSFVYEYDKGVCVGPGYGRNVF